MRQVPKKMEDDLKMNYRKCPKFIIVIALVVFIVSGLTIAQIVRPANAQQERAFHFQANAGSTTTTPPQVIIMFGTGSFDRDGGPVKGGGIFQIFNSSSPTPKIILASGTWQAGNLVSYTEVGTWGVFAAGTAVMNINLVLSNGTSEPARLTQVCNIGPAGLSTGTPEGITVVIGGDTLTPVNGLTVFDVLGG